MNPSLSNPSDLAQKLAKLSRPQNILYPGTLAAISCYVFTDNLILSALCYLFIFLVYAVAATYNNIRDIRTDELNHRTDNPLVYKGLLRHQALWFLGVITLLLCCLQFALSQPYTLLVAGLYLLLLYAYSGAPNFKSRSWLGILLLAICYGGLPILLGVVQSDSPISTQLAIGVAMNAGLLYPFLLAKDYKDVKGDRATGVNTPLIIHGPKLIHIVAVSISVFSSLVLVFVSLGHSYIHIIVPLLLMYVLYIHHLHLSKGKISPVLIKIGSLLLLALSVFVLRYIQTKA